ncbi:MAG: hypothetical protein ACUVT2_09660 [Thiobacillaceae bacterium]
MTESPRDLRPIAYVIILLGLATAAAAALVPQYAIGYKLKVGVLLALLTPYIVYGALTESLRGAALLLPGLILLAVNVGLLLYERILYYDGYANSPVYWLPLLTAAIVLTIAYRMRARAA